MGTGSSFEATCEGLRLARLALFEALLPPRASEERILELVREVNRLTGLQLHPPDQASEPTEVGQARSTGDGRASTHLADDLRVHITKQDLHAARQAWLSAIADGSELDRVQVLYEDTGRLTDARAQQIADDLRES